MFNNSTLDIKGSVEIYKIFNKTKKVLVNKSNLIVYTGREWVLSCIFNKPNNYINLQPGMFIYWISFGSGGAPLTAPLEPIPPQSTDISLNSELVLNDNEPTYADGGRKHPIDNVTFLQDPKNSNRYLIARAEILLDETEAVGLDINEAGLWISNSSDPNEANTFILFAKTTFPTISKRADFGLQILWNIYV